LERLIRKQPGGLKILAGTLFLLLSLAVSPFDSRGYVSGSMFIVGFTLVLIGLGEWLMADT
jgi:hypothetical protein